MKPRLIHKNERSLFIVSLIISAFIYIALLFSIAGIPYLVIGLLITFFLHGLMVGHIRTNGVKLTPQQFASYDKMRELCLLMDIKKIPDVYVLQSDGMLNAFATRFFGRNMVVLYSELFELAETGEQEELTYVLAHELAHIKRNHILKSLFIIPAMWVPFLGKAYSRSCEYTCDRIAAVFTGNAMAAIRGLTILAIGRTLHKKLNITEYVAESAGEGGFFVWLSKVTSTHPPLPRRISSIQHLQQFPEQYGYSSAAFERQLSA